MHIKDSELILNPDGSIYHLNLKPGDISNTIITVGDQERVNRIAKHLDEIIFSTQKREFKTITGTYKGKLISIISTGIGTDNIDIVFNELDALFNIDFSTRTVREHSEKLTFVRLGTSGALLPELGTDALLISTGSIGTEGLLNFYAFEDNASLYRIALDANMPILPYYAAADPYLLQHFDDGSCLLGVTVTANGFYGPQRRTIRLQTAHDNWLLAIKEYGGDNMKITNLEMETAGIYGLAYLLGHRAISINALLANRATGSFSKDPQAVEEKMITWALDKIVSL